MNRFYTLEKNRNSCLQAHACMLALLLFLVASSVMAAPKKKEPVKKEPFVVSTTVAAGQPKVRSMFKGLNVSADGRSGKNVQREWQETIMPDFGQALVFQVKAHQ